MEHLPTLEEIENQVTAQTVKTDPTGFTVLEQALDFFIEVLREVSHLKASSDQEYTSYLMVMNGFYSQTGAFRLMARGYYRQAAGLLRTSMEDWVTCHYLWGHPEDLSLWLEDANYKKRPKFATMAKGLEEPYRSRWNQTYGILSELAHPRMTALLVADAQVGASGPYFDQQLFRGLARECILIILSEEATIPWLSGVVSHAPDLIKLRLAVEENFRSWLGLDNT